MANRRSSTKRTVQYLYFKPNISNSNIHPLQDSIAIQDRGLHVVRDVNIKGKRNKNYDGTGDR